MSNNCKLPVCTQCDTNAIDTKCTSNFNAILERGSGLKNCQQQYWQGSIFVFFKGLVANTLMDFVPLYFITFQQGSENQAGFSISSITISNKGCVSQIMIIIICEQLLCFRRFAQTLLGEEVPGWRAAHVDTLVHEEDEHYWLPQV